MRSSCLIIIAAALTAGCFSSKPIDAVAGAQGEPQTLGAITLASERLGHLTVAPTTCQAGTRQSFLGGDFQDPKSGMVVRLVVDPLDGPAVRVFEKATPFDKSLVFRRAECRTFHFSLEATGWRVNDVDDYRLSLDVDCARGGESVEGKVSTTHCH
ncbi:MAG TPA: hypothetical protein VEZ11_03070 [Thermoanaerobaculia bacterium]|nr:hypothetical protein [Thermoanaerobaculia bacterium]